MRHQPFRPTTETPDRCAHHGRTDSHNKCSNTKHPLQYRQPTTYPTAKPTRSPTRRTNTSSNGISYINSECRAHQILLLRHRPPPNSTGAPSSLRRQQRLLSCHQWCLQCLRRDVQYWYSHQITSLFGTTRSTELKALYQEHYDKLYSMC